MRYSTDIFDYVNVQEAAYKQKIAINESWDWGMYEHILLTELYTNSQLKNGKNDFTPVKNIIRPILNVQHRTEDIEVKDVQIYVDEPDRYHLSFLVKKYHDDVFTKENDMDTFFDELNVSRIDYGGGLSKQLNKPCPEVVPLQSIAFCDQTDILSGPIGLKHFYSPDQLLDMKSKGWGNEKNGATISVEDLIILSRDEKSGDGPTDSVKTPGRYIEIYEIHGNLPKKYFDKEDDTEEYETRIAIVAFYQKKSSDGKSGVILYTAPEATSPFKLIKRDPVYGRALGFGGAEELFESQVWTNYDMIRMQDMLDSSSKVFLQHKGSVALQDTNLKDKDNLEVFEMGLDESLTQVDTFPRNYQLFERSIAEWENHGKETGGATDPLQGAQPSSGTPFASLQAQIQQGLGLHQYRRGIYAKHLEEIYKDWVIPHIQREITKGTKFLSELSLDELQYVADCIVRSQSNKVQKEYVLNTGGLAMTPQQVQALEQDLQTQFKKRGNKHFIEILKGEFKDVDLGVKVSIAGKSKDLSGMVDKLTNVFKTIIASPYILQSPPIAQLFNKIIEGAGLDPIDLSNFKVPPLPTRTIRSTIDYADVGAAQPTPQQEAMLELSGLQPPSQQTQQAQPQPNQPLAPQPRQ